MLSRPCSPRQPQNNPHSMLTQRFNQSRASSDMNSSAPNFTEPGLSSCHVKTAASASASMLRAVPFTCSFCTLQGSGLGYLRSRERDIGELGASGRAPLPASQALEGHQNVAENTRTCFRRFEGQAIQARAPSPCNGFLHAAARRRSSHFHTHVYTCICLEINTTNRT